jgi:hypothetical protein
MFGGLPVPPAFAAVYHVALTSHAIAAENPATRNALKSGVRKSSNNLNLTIRGGESMGLLNKILAPFKPPSIEDPDFGTLLYMDIPRNPSKSYWECEWLFPPTGTRISISLPGNREGPRAEARAFYLGLPADFNRIVDLARPRLDQAIRRWLHRPLNDDLWKDVSLSGFGVEDPAATPREWDISFETTGSKWLGITIPFVGDEPQDPVIDT